MLDCDWSSDVCSSDLTVGRQARLIAEAAWTAGLGTGAVVSCGTVSEAAVAIREHVRPGDCVLVKASRGMKLEALVPQASPRMRG
jgi:UDP-N-acetylmuramyl pentapeptide synthase